MQTRCCSPSTMCRQGRGSPGSASHSPPSSQPSPRPGLLHHTSTTSLLSPWLPLPAFRDLLPGRFPLSWLTLPRQTSGRGGSPCAMMPALPRGAALLGDPCHLPSTAPRVHLINKRGRGMGCGTEKPGSAEQGGAGVGPACTCSLPALSSALC